MSQNYPTPPVRLRGDNYKDEVDIAVEYNKSVGVNWTRKEAINLHHDAPTPDIGSMGSMDGNEVINDCSPQTAVVMSHPHALHSVLILPNRSLSPGG